MMSDITFSRSTLIKQLPTYTLSLPAQLLKCHSQGKLGSFTKPLQLCNTFFLFSASGPIDVDRIVTEHIAVVQSWGTGNLARVPCGRLRRLGMQDK